MKAIIQMQRAKESVAAYSGNMSLSLHLKNYFRQHKEMGSKDRKFLQQLAFQYFRLNNALTASGIEDKIVLSHLLLNQQPDNFSAYWINEIALPNDFNLNSNYSEKAALFNQSGLFTDLQNQFPLAENITAEIDADSFLKSHLSQPFTWIRCKRKNIAAVKNELTSLHIDFKISALSDCAIGFEKHTDFTILNSYKKGFFEVQDLSSQLTGNLFLPAEQQSWWDCCAASGGKSLLLKDIESSVNLLATDTRASILENLKLRFKRANLTKYEVSTADLESDKPAFSQKFDGIMLDAPCTGSGTWGRNPERMSFFNHQELNAYTEKQYKIALNVVRQLKPNGRLIYITCSVYRQENEENVARIAKATNLQIKASQYFKGYEYNADTMFVAVLGC